MFEIPLLIKLFISLIELKTSKEYMSKFKIDKITYSKSLSKTT